MHDAYAREGDIKCLQQQLAICATRTKHYVDAGVLMNMYVYFLSDFDRVSKAYAKHASLFWAMCFLLYMEFKSYWEY
jgi:uncharacterized membrane protein YobD (UPF0266 family)